MSVHVWMRASDACVCVCVTDGKTDRQGWRAARTAYVVHLANNNNISLTVNNGPGRADTS